MPSGSERRPEIMKDHIKSEDEILLDSLGDEPKDSSGILSQEEIDGFISEVAPKELTPEAVAKVWNKFNNFEKKIVFVDDGFEKWIEKYQSALLKQGKNEKETAEKIQVIRSIRKMIQADDPRASKIERPL